MDATGKFTRLVPVLLCSLAGAVATIGWARPVQSGSSGFRCPTTARLVSLGQSMIEVRGRCREPDDAHTGVELRSVRETTRRWVQGVAQEISVERTIEIPVDEWTYDFGRNRFIQFLHFEYGRLVSTSEGAKGTADPE